MFLLWLRQLPWCGDCTLASVPSPTKGKSSPTNTPVFPPSSFILPIFAWSCIFFSSGQVLSWCSAVHSQLVFSMHFSDWRCIYSWCIRGERCTPRLPTPPSSCSPLHMLGSWVDIMQHQPSVSGWVSNQCPCFYLLGKLQDSRATHCWRSMAVGLTCLFLSEIQHYCSNLFWNCVRLPDLPCLRVCLANCLEGTEYCDNNRNSHNNNI